jgi:PDZ domain-containing protein
MVTAKQLAEYVALTKLGFPTKIVQGPVVVDQFLCQVALGDDGSCSAPPPSEVLLDRGDAIVAIDGEPTPDGDSLRAALAEHRIGDHVTVTATRGSQTVTGDVELISSQEDTPRPILGFRPADTSTVQTPFSIAIATQDIGGPSAGLAFTLTILDELTPGSIMGAAKVAVTGTISVDGTVGAIGGLTSKTEAVKQTGASVFIVPTAQGEDDLAAARAVAGDSLRIIPVSTLDEALAALASLGGNALDLGQPGAGYHAS